MLSGQMYGYLQPCGCRRPQLGGLERRANFIRGLRDRGWPVTALDLGDVLPVAGVVPEQAILKYGTTMAALREMGYSVVGVGRAELSNGLYRVLAEYALKKEQPPYTLAGNVGGKSGDDRITSRDSAFPGPGSRPLVGSGEVVSVGKIRLGVVGAVGASVRKAVEPLSRIGFTGQKESLAAAVKEFATRPDKPDVLILLYQGTAAEAREVVASRPEFHVILCLSPDPEAPEKPETVTRPDGGKTLVVRVGQKGQYVGAIGVHRGPGGLDLRYQLVPLGEEYVTPGTEDEARRVNPVLPFLDQYAATVRDRSLLAKFPQSAHPAQVRQPTLSYVGSDRCASCHAAEYDAWKVTQHARAMDALEKVAKRPEARNHDGECVVCHTVGLAYKTGYRDELTTPNLKHVGCEACHGPGSGHAADPKNPALLALQSMWRPNSGDRLPPVAEFGRLAGLAADDREAALSPTSKRAVASVGRLCAGCHDRDNDPLFDLVTYWPKVAHLARKK
ncbi:cytochrome c-554 [Fimbriiglobus ruber]|uniref:Cytochrome c-554 n=1 Tax=Fimbriiglobus ruber TaxID=1908690 RepID=A0A225D9Q6_9BACT|nr:cytochrome c-554 [Fimbriiglobus ruber]